MKKILLAATATFALAGSALAADQTTTPMNAAANGQNFNAANGQTLSGYVTFVDPSTNTILVSNQPFQVSAADVVKLAPGDSVVIKPAAAENANAASNGALPATVVSVAPNKG